LTGWPASAIRATVMLTVVIIGWLLRRPTDLLNSLFAAAVIILVWEPRQLFQAGFQLSFLVVLCIILLMPLLRAGWERLWAPDPLVPARLRPRWRRWFRAPGRYVSDLLLTSFAAWIGSIPLVAYYFNLVTPVSTPANIVAVPLCALVLMSNLASLLLAPWLPVLSQVFNQAGWFLMELIRITSTWFAAWPKAYYYSAAPGWLTTLVYYAVLLALATGWLVRPKRRLLRWLAVGGLILIWGASWWAGLSVKRLTILNLSGGYGLYCDLPGKADDLLIDPGTTNAVQFLTKPFLRAQGVNRLSGLLLSHGDLHQMGGALMVEELFGAKQVIVGPLGFRSPVYRRTLQSFEARSKPVRVVSRGDSAAGWSVLHPDAGDKFPVADDKALVLARTIQGSRVLLLSDLGRPGQEALLSRESDLRADILIAGLPVKPEALCEALLEAINPRLIVVCDSEFPASARAGKSLRERLARRGAQVIYTRFAGSVTIEFGNQSWQVRTMNPARLPEIRSGPEQVSDPGDLELTE
jgi:competence protein ComEC